MSDLLSVASESFLLTKSELVAELCDVGLESVLDNNSLPLARYIKPVAKIGACLRERNLIRNTMYFLQGFQSNDIDEDKLIAYKRKLKEDYKYYEQETSRLVIILSNTVEVIRAKILGCLYMNMVNGRITYSEFCEYSDLTTRLYVTEFDYLCSNSKSLEKHTYSRLVGLGLMTHDITHTYDNGNVTIYQPYEWTKYGKKYADIINGII